MIRRGRYAYFGAGRSGTTDDEIQAEIWLQNSLEPASLYIRLDVHRQAMTLLQHIRSVILEFEDLAAIDDEVWDAVDRAIEDGQRDIHIWPTSNEPNTLRNTQGGVDGP